LEMFNHDDAERADQFVVALRTHTGL
jgi:hypothetical protein